MGFEFATLYHGLLARAQASPEAPALWQRDAAGQWQSRSWREFAEAVARVATGLGRLGLGAGDRVGIFAATSAEWEVAQMAVFALGGVVVGLDVHEHDARLAHMVERAQLRVLVVDTPDRLERLPQAARRRLEAVVAFRGVEPSCVPWPALLATAPAPCPGPAPEMDALVVFTSGTTGEPKGIAYSHRQTLTACTAILDAFPGLGEGGRLACWLPLSNLFQRMIDFCAILRGGQIFYVENPRAIMDQVASIAPDVFIAVPRFYEKFFAGVQAGVARRPAWQRGLFRLALGLGRRRVEAEQAGRPVPPLLGFALRWLDPLTFAPARAALGGRLKVLVSGSAPMPRSLLRDMAAIGLPIYEAYGMSENIVPNCMNRPGAVRFGTVGQVLAPNRLRIAEDGEVWVAGPGTFGGYLGEAPVPRSVDGFIPTGDYGRLDSEGFLTLVGRKSELFKTATGRRIAPVPIEERLRCIPGVEAAMVVGANRPFLVALVWSTPEAAGALAPRLAEAAATACADLPDYQRPAGFVLVPRAPSLDQGELTANLKLRRPAVEQLHGEALDRLYQDLAGQRGPTVRWAQP